MRKAGVLVIALAGLLGLSGVASAVPTTDQHYTVVAKDPQGGARIKVPNGDKLQLQLTACESCGYQWKITKKPNPAVIAFDKQLKSVSQCTGSNCVGGNATERFQFLSKSVGSTTVKLGYFGPGKTKPSKVKSLALVVTA